MTRYPKYDSRKEPAPYYFQTQESAPVSQRLADQEIWYGHSIFTSSLFPQSPPKEPSQLHRQTSGELRVHPRGGNRSGNQNPKIPVWQISAHDHVLDSQTNTHGGKERRQVRRSGEDVDSDLIALTPGRGTWNRQRRRNPMRHQRANTGIDPLPHQRA